MPLMPRRGVSGLWKKATKVVVQEVQDARQARREEAAEELQSAVACKDRDRIISAMGQAKAARVDKKTVSEATKVLQRLMAMEWLEEVKGRRSADEMRNALSRAKAAGLTSKQLEEYEHILNKLDAELLLIAVTQRNESGAIRIAIQGARSNGLKGQVVETAEQKLAELEAIHTLQVAMKSGQALRIQKALEKVPSKGSEVVEEARRMLAGLESDGDGSRGLSRSLTAGARSPTLGGKSPIRRGTTRNLTFGLDEEQGDSEEAMDETEERLWRAISFRETGALKLTLSAARAYGSRYAAAIAEAERVLAQMEAVWQLNAAAKKGDVGKLREAIERAVAAGVEEQAMGGARLLVEQADARTALSAAIKGRESAQLEAALAAARSCGVDRARLARAEQALAQLQGPSKESGPSGVRRTGTGLNRATDTQVVRSAAVAGSQR